jgi:hypothetical protein
MIEYNQAKIDEMYQACTTQLSDEIRVTRHDLFVLAAKNLMSDAFIQGMNYAMNRLNEKIVENDQKH